MIDLRLLRTNKKNEDLCMVLLVSSYIDDLLQLWAIYFT